MTRIFPPSVRGWALAVLTLAGVSFFMYPKWTRTWSEATLSWDVSGYYLYLPALFIYGDLKDLEFFPALVDTYHPAPGFDQAFEHPSGHRVMKYTCGQAIAMLPGFAAAHVWTRLTGAYPADGFSLPYQFGISMGALLLAFLGLWVLRKVLLAGLPESVTGLVLVLLVWGTNYLDYAAINGAMTHNTLFTVYALLLWVSLRYHERPSLARALAAGALTGYATLIRPTEAISVLIPLLWGLESLRWPALKDRLDFWWRHRGHLVAAGAVAGAIGAIQLIYWKWVTGEWIVYSYQDQGFSWLHPHLMDGLFSYRSGWLIYSPLLIFALLGIPLLFRTWKPAALTVTGFILFFTYIAFAWDIWWYGGSLGQRSMVQAYPALAIPLGAFITRLPVKKWIRGLFWGVTLLFCLYNGWLTWQAHRGGMLITGEMTGPYFWKILGRMTPDRDDLKLLDTNEDQGGDRYNTRILTHLSASTDSLAVGCGPDPDPGNRSWCLRPGTEFQNLADLPFTSPGGWVGLSVRFHAGDKEWEVWKMPNLVLEWRHQGEVVKHKNIRIWRILEPGETREIRLDAEVPDEPVDQLLAYLWNPGSAIPLAYDEVWLTTFDRF